MRYVLAIVLIDDYFLTVKTCLRSTRLIFNLNYSFSSYQIALHRTEHVTLNHVTQSCHSGASWSWNESPSPSYPITREHIGSGWTYRNVYKRICMYISCSNRGPCHDVRMRPRPNWELYLDNLIWMYFLVSKLAIGSWQITSLKIC